MRDGAHTHRVIFTDEQQERSEDDLLLDADIALWSTEGHGCHGIAEPCLATSDQRWLHGLRPAGFARRVGEAMRSSPTAQAFTTNPARSTC
ncbi:MAG: hypothetical protein WKF84_29240 [Pyrinomonadaceae bacterium]